MKTHLVHALAYQPGCWQEADTGSRRVTEERLTRDTVFNDVGRGLREPVQDCSPLPGSGAVTAPGWRRKRKSSLGRGLSGRSSNEAANLQRPRQGDEDSPLLTLLASLDPS